MIKLSDYIIKVLEEYGITHIFGLTGGMAMYLFNSLGNSKKIKFIPMLHEQSAGIASESYSIYKNDLAVYMTTAGPGILNAINPIASAWVDSNPLLVISGQCKSTDCKADNMRSKGVQEVDAVSILKPITKYAVSIKKADEIRYHLEKAIYLAMHGRRGPVFLEIPLDIQNQEIDETKLKGYIYYDEEKINVENYLINYNKKKINKVIDLINNSKRPVILAGNGIRLSNSLNEFIKLVYLLQIPTLLTWKSLDFLDFDTEYNFGCPGSISSRYSNFCLQNSDLVICIGTRLDLPTIAYSWLNFAPNAKKVIVDIDESELYKYYSTSDIKIELDAKIFIEELLNRIEDINIYKKIESFEWYYKCRKWKKKYPICLPEYYNEKDYVNSYVFIEELSKILNENDIIVASSSGSASEITCQSFKIKGGQRFICSNGLGSMGYAIDQSIGAAFASNKEKRIICIEGDGSFQLNIQSLQTIKQHNLPIKLIIFNNNGYGSIRNTHNKFFNCKLVGCDNTTDVTFPEIYNISDAYGFNWYKVYRHLDLDYILNCFLNDKELSILEVLIDPNQQTQFKVQNNLDENGKIISGTLENLYPFLSKEELEKNMIKD